MVGARHIFPGHLLYRGHTTSPVMVWELFFLELVQAVRASSVLVDQCPHRGCCCCLLFSLATFQLALGSVWNWSESGSLMKGENVMLLITAEALDSSISGFQTDLFLLLPGHVPWGVGLPLSNHISPATSAFCYIYGVPFNT